MASINITSLLKHLDEALMRQELILQLVIANYLFLDTKFFVETVVSMADMARVFVFMYDLL